MSDEEDVINVLIGNDTMIQVSVHNEMFRMGVLRQDAEHEGDCAFKQESHVYMICEEVMLLINVLQAKIDEAYPPKVVSANVVIHNGTQGQQGPCGDE